MLKFLTPLRLLHAMVFCSSKMYFVYIFVKYNMKNFLKKYLQNSNSIRSSGSLAPSTYTNNRLSRFDESILFTKIDTVFNSHINIFGPIICTSLCKHIKFLDESTKYSHSADTISADFAAVRFIFLDKIRLVRYQKFAIADFSKKFHTPQ